MYKNFLNTGWKERTSNMYQNEQYVMCLGIVKFSQVLAYEIVTGERLIFVFLFVPSIHLRHVRIVRSSGESKWMDCPDCWYSRLTPNRWYCCPVQDNVDIHDIPCKMMLMGFGCGSFARIQWDVIADIIAFPHEIPNISYWSIIYVFIGCKP